MQNKVANREAAQLVLAIIIGDTIEGGMKIFPLLLLDGLRKKKKKNCFFWLILDLV